MDNVLAQVDGLKVAARTSSFKFRGDDHDIVEIGNALNVSAVLEGSVRKAGDTVRVTVQLIHGPTDAQVWSETWDRELDDIFAIQNEIASHVVDQLRMELIGEIPRSKSVNSQAFLLFLEADHLMRFGTPGGEFLDNVRKAVDLLEQALDIARRVLNYTNHTLLPEALERWATYLMGTVLPRHMQIIERIDSWHRRTWPARPHWVGIVKHHEVRMGDLAFVMSHRVNGVSALHTELMKQTVFGDLHALHPNRIVNQLPPRTKIEASRMSNQMRDSVPSTKTSPRKRALAIS